MNAPHWLRKIFPGKRASARRPGTTRLHAEFLEGRCVPSIVIRAAFYDGVNGSYPVGALAEDPSGNLFGATNQGGQFNDGTIFELPAGSGTLITLASFNGANGSNPFLGPVLDGNGNLFGLTFQGAYELPRGSGTITMLPGLAHISGLVVDSSGNLFGTAGGGPTYDGFIFQYQPGTGIVTILATFNGPNGVTPSFGSLFMDSGGNLFGSTQQGGAGNAGTVFELPKGSHTLTTLASFPSGSGSPIGGVVVDPGGNVFGTLQPPGSVLAATIFEVKHGSGLVSGLASVGQPDEGATFATLAIDSNGNLFGTLSGFFGEAFEVSPATGNVTYLPVFTGQTAAAVTVDGSGNLFVMSTGVNDPQHPHGSLFELASGSGTYTLLASFTGSGGYFPVGLVQDSSGNLFGVTLSGGTSGDGTVFELPKGSTTIKPVAAFNGSSDPYPFDGLLLDSSGNLFGMTERGGSNDYGMVFEVQHGSANITALASFTSSQFGYSGGLLVDSSGNLFGTRQNGGGNYGTFFEVPKGSGTATTLASFNAATGIDPGPLIEDNSGNYYGLTSGYGPTNATVFEIQKGMTTITTLVTFPPSISPSSLVIDSSGNLFGTTTHTSTNAGTVFEVPAGSHTIVPVATFNGSDQPDPGNLVVDTNGNLFGMTFSGLTITSTLFEIKAGTTTITTLGSLSSALGSNVGALVVDSNGNLFGTLSEGGPFNNGSIFEVPASAPPVFGTSSLKSWTVNQPGYSQPITVSGGTAPYTFSTAGPLPVGLTLSSAGVVSGMPSAAGTYTFTISVIDNADTITSQAFTVTINPPPTITTATLASGTIGASYAQSIRVSGGTGSSVFAVTGTLPSGLTLSSSGVLAGTPTATGSYSFTVTATDTTGASSSQWYTVAIAPLPFSQYLVTVLGPTAIQAGTSFLVSVQEATASGNPVTTYTGPVVVSATASLNNGPASLLSTVTLSSGGLGLFIASFQKAGSYTITLGSGSITGSAAVTVTPGQAVRLGFASQPWSTATGVTLVPVTVQVQDLYGNVVTSDNSDTVTIGVASGPGSFASVSTLTATVQNGVAAFNNLTLIVPGSYTLSALVPGLYTGPNSTPFTISPLQAVRASLLGASSGFSVQFNAPLLVNAMTPVLYGSGTAVTPTVTLTQETGTPPAGASLPYQVPGSVIVDAATNTLTFLETDTESLVDYGTPALPDGTYVAHISGNGASGLQAPGAGYLDGTNAGTPGHDFTATFTVGGSTSYDVLWLPDTAAGPGQALSAPGMNQVGGGYPVYLDDVPRQYSYSVTDVMATLTYNPSLLTLTPASSATFTVTVPSPGTALLHYHGGNLPISTNTPIGYLMATVPSGTAANPLPYRAENLLHLSNVMLDESGFIVATADGLHLVTYVGDADGNGSYSSSDAVLITRALLRTDTGFAAYPLVDPVIVADTDGSGFIPSDAALQVNEAGVGVPTQNLAIPPISSGVHFMALAEHARLTPRIVTEVFGRTVQTTKSTKDTTQEAAIDAALVDPWFDVMGITKRRTTHALLAGR